MNADQLDQFLDSLVEIKHVRGNTRIARPALSTNGITRFIWVDGNGSEGVDIINATGKSTTFGSWSLN